MRMAFYTLGGRGKMDGKTLILAAYVLMNFIGLHTMKADKQRAIKHQYRIPEKTLWLVALFGGAIGTLMGMQMYRHKTKHLSFMIGFPLLAVIEFLAFVYINLKMV
jgi:uncharacterized membrane protein YsdA (DUF1294 family)